MTYVTTELTRALMADRQREVRGVALARAARLARACCEVSASLLARLVATIRRQPSAC